MARIFVAGEALIDFVPSTTAAGERAFVPHPGGSPFNAAKAAALAGGEAHFVGTLSTDFLGHMLREDLSAAGVALDGIASSDKPSALAFVDLSTGEPAYAFHFEGTAEAVAAPSLEGMAPEPGDIVHVGSISLAGEAADRIADFAVAEAGRRMVSLDPNARPVLIHDRPGWERHMERLMDVASILKLSSEDLDYMRPGTAPVDYARGAVERGVPLAIVTGGGEGARAITPSGEASVAAPRVEVADTVGAGDTLMGAALAWIAERGTADRDALAALDGDALTALLRFATVAAAINCTRHGCKPPTRAEIDAFTG